MRISDWSSDVCSSDLEGKGEERLAHQWLLAVNSTPRPASTIIPTTNSTTRRGIGCSRRVSFHAISTAIAANAALTKRAIIRASPNRTAMHQIAARLGLSTNPGEEAYVGRY